MTLELDVDGKAKTIERELTPDPKSHSYFGEVKVGDGGDVGTRADLQQRGRLDQTDPTATAGPARHQHHRRDPQHLRKEGKQ